MARILLSISVFTLAICTLRSVSAQNAAGRQQSLRQQQNPYQAGRSSSQWPTAQGQNQGQPRVVGPPSQSGNFQAVNQQPQPQSPQPYGQQPQAQVQSRAQQQQRGPAREPEPSAQWAEAMDTEPAEYEEDYNYDSMLSGSGSRTSLSEAAQAQRAADACANVLANGAGSPAHAFASSPAEKERAIDSFLARTFQLLSDHTHFLLTLVPHASLLYTDVAHLETLCREHKSSEEKYNRFKEKCSHDAYAMTRGEELRQRMMQLDLVCREQLAYARSNEMLRSCLNVAAAANQECVRQFHEREPHLSSRALLLQFQAHEPPRSHIPRSPGAAAAQQPAQSLTTSRPRANCHPFLCGGERIITVNGSQAEHFRKQINAGAGVGSIDPFHDAARQRRGGAPNGGGGGGGSARPAGATLRSEHAAHTRWQQQQRNAYGQQQRRGGGPPLERRAKRMLQSEKTSAGELSKHWSDLRGCVAAAVRDRCSSAAAADLLHPLEGLRFRSLSYSELLTLGLLVQNRDQTLGQIAFALAASVPHDRAPYTAPSRPRSRPGAGRGHDSLDTRQTNVDSNVKGDQTLTIGTLVREQKVETSGAVLCAAPNVPLALLVSLALAAAQLLDRRLRR